ncbi:MAG: tetratricopeptide repeat protein [Pyrinomonadaceae bacterium]
MNRCSRQRGAAVALILTVLVALVSLQAGCRRGAQGNANANAGKAAAAKEDGAAPSTDISQLNGEIERLEKQAERNPADEDTQDELARTYVKRAKAEQAGGQFQEALVDYQSALRHDPDNDDAQAGAAAVDQQLGGDQQEDENGAPAPLPITPGVADEEGKPTPTPKKPQMVNGK